MAHFTEDEQISIFKNCNTATELLQYRELLEEYQPLDKVALMAYNIKMEFFLIDNLI